MFTFRSFAFALLALSMVSVSLANVEKPYAPDLFDRDSLEADLTSDNVKIVNRGFPSDSARPYSPDLYFRSELEDETAQPTKSAPTSFITQITKRSPSLNCKRDSDCGGAHFCSSGNCFMRKAKRALCSRDAMCNSGFCGSQGACLEKRSLGSTCADSTSACTDDLFCSDVDKKCRQKRGLDESCRFSEGCQEGLTCLNYKCSQSLVKKTFFNNNDDDNQDDPFSSLLNHLKEKGDQFKEDSKEFKDKLDHLWKQPSASGFPFNPISLEKRSQDSNSYDHNEQLSNFVDHLKEKGQEFKEQLEDHWKSSPSGHHHHPIFLNREVKEPAQPAPSR